MNISFGNRNIKNILFRYSKTEQAITPQSSTINYGETKTLFTSTKGGVCYVSGYVYAQNSRANVVRIYSNGEEIFYFSKAASFSYQYFDVSFVISRGDVITCSCENSQGGGAYCFISTIKQTVETGKIKEVYYGRTKIGPKALCFTANTSGSKVALSKYQYPTSVSLETSTDGVTWSDYTINTYITLNDVGSKIYIRNKSTETTGFSNANAYYYFIISGSVDASGDVTSLINKNGTDTLLAERCFYRLFQACTGLKTPPLLPATTLTPYCYYYMFVGCTGLKTSPALPATTLTPYCYAYMFTECASLERTPSLPATTLAQSCYQQMFSVCKGLTTIPALPATTLEKSCYYFMFYNSNVKISSTKTGIYQTEYRIPTEGTGTTATDALGYMFSSTAGTFKSTPSINTTYYTANEVI